MVMLAFLERLRLFVIHDTHQAIRTDYPWWLTHWSGCGPACWTVNWGETRVIIDYSRSELSTLSDIISFFVGWSIFIAYYVYSIPDPDPCNEKNRFSNRQRILVASWLHHPYRHHFTSDWRGPQLVFFGSVSASPRIGTERASDKSVSKEYHLSW